MNKFKSWLCFRLGLIFYAVSMYDSYQYWMGKAVDYDEASGE